MTKLREVINLKAAFLGSVFLTALSGLVPESAGAGSIVPGNFNLKCHILGDPNCLVDPPPGRYFEGRITLKYNKNLLSINEFGWFGELSNQPETLPPAIGGEPFIGSNLPYELLPPNSQLEVTACSILNGDNFTVNSNGEIIGTGCDFDITQSLVLPGNDTPQFFQPQPEDNILAVDFSAGADGLQVNTEENFYFFGFNYELLPGVEEIVGMKLVPAGEGDLGVVPNQAFNTILCTPNSDQIDVPLETCDYGDISSEFKFITESELAAESTQPGFIFDAATNRGFMASGEPFQLNDGISLQSESIDEPSNKLGLIALGAFGIKLALKRKRKYSTN